MATTFTLPDATAVEALSAEEILALVPAEFAGKGLARVLLPEGGDGAARHALRHRAEGARLRDRHASPLPRDVRALARGRGALRHEGGGVRGAERRGVAATHGESLWERKPDLYLAIAKVEPLVRALGGLDCWITGVRRDQSATRANAAKLGWDAAHELWKANPLADWSDDDCWSYIRERGLPYNALHDRGYESIGDTHSTIPGAGREGRWADTGRTECGLHVEEPHQ